MNTRETKLIDSRIAQHEGQVKRLMKNAEKNSEQLNKLMDRLNRLREWKSA